VENAAFFLTGSTPAERTAEALALMGQTGRSLIYSPNYVFNQDGGAWDPYAGPGGLEQLTAYNTPVVVQSGPNSGLLAFTFDATIRKLCSEPRNQIYLRDLLRGSEAKWIYWQ
jgi:hypothetical protein